MKKLMVVLTLAAGLSGCYYPGYAVRRVGPSEPPLSREEVERLAGAGVSEPVIGEMIEKRGAAPLSSDDLVALKKAGVPDPVVQKMIASERKQTEHAVVDEYYAYPSYYYYGYPYYHPYGYGYYPYYGASFSYGVGWGWGYGGHYHSHPRGSLGVRAYR